LPSERSRSYAPVLLSRPPGSARFPKADHILLRADFLRAMAQGRRLHTRHFGITLMSTPQARPRLGLAVTKRLGKAARRNRVKRLLREFFRRHREKLPPEDLIIMAKKGAADLDYRQVQEELSRALFPRMKGKSLD